MRVIIRGRPLGLNLFLLLIRSVFIDVITIIILYRSVSELDPFDLLESESEVD